MTRLTTAYLTVIALFVATLHSSSSFVISPRTNRASSGVGATTTLLKQEHTSYKTITTPRGNPTPTSLSALTNDSQGFQEDLKKFGKTAVNVAEKVGKAVGWAALKGMQQGYKGIKHVIEETQNNEQVQQGVELLKNAMGDAPKQEVKERLNKINMNSSVDAGDPQDFDTEDEELFREIPKKRPEVFVDAELLEGIRVVGGPTNRIIDAEIITKTWSR